MRDFCFAMDKNRPNFFEKLKEEGVIRSKINHMSEMNEAENKEFMRQRVWYRNQHYKTFAEV